LISPPAIAYRVNGMPARSTRSATDASRRAPNNVQRLREEMLLTKAELARKAGVSPLTVSRVESGLDCRVDTKRKIILALGLQPTDKARVFGHDAARRAESSAASARKGAAGTEPRRQGLAASRRA
jgi:DNA-binding XRE family transcriptional regulator